VKIRNIIEQFRHYAEDKSGYRSDDTSYSDFAIYEKLVLFRSSYLNSSNYDKLSEHMYQTLPCVSFELVDQNECGLIPPSGCKILKSTCPMPKTIKIKSFSKQLGQPIDFVRWDRTEVKSNSNISKIRNSTYYTIRNINGDNYLYLVNDTFLKNGTLVAILEDPLDGYRFCNEKSICDPYELDFHTDSSILDAIITMAWQSLPRVRSTAEQDLENNDRKD
jgi:hypothetical protein